jgi:hypothetical protein
MASRHGLQKQDGAPGSLGCCWGGSSFLIFLRFQMSTFRALLASPPFSNVTTSFRVCKRCMCLKPCFNFAVRMESVYCFIQCKHHSSPDTKRQTTSKMSGLSISKTNSCESLPFTRHLDFYKLRSAGVTSCYSFLSVVKQESKASE